jgi:hypothetical protein
MSVVLMILLIAFCVQALVRFAVWFLVPYETRIRRIASYYDRDGRIISFYDSITLIILVALVILLMLTEMHYLSFITGLVVGMLTIQVFFHRFSKSLTADKCLNPPHHRENSCPTPSRRTRASQARDRLYDPYCSSGPSTCCSSKAYDPHPGHGSGARRFQISPVRAARRPRLGPVPLAPMPTIPSTARCRRGTSCIEIFLAQTERSISDTGNARPWGVMYR